MGSGDDMSAVDEGTSASDFGVSISAPVLDVDQPGVVVDQVRAGFDTTFGFVCNNDKFHKKNDKESQTQLKTFMTVCSQKRISSVALATRAASIFRSKTH